MTAMSVLRRVRDAWDVLLANDASHAKAEWVKMISPRVSGCQLMTWLVSFPVCLMRQPKVGTPGLHTMAGGSILLRI